MRVLLAPRFPTHPSRGIQPHFARLPRWERAPFKSKARSRNTGYVGGRSMEQKRYWLASVIAVAASCAGAGQSLAYVQTNLVSDIPGLATITDSVREPLGHVAQRTSPFWTSNQGTNTSTLYAVTGTTTVSKFTPTRKDLWTFRPRRRPQGPTGQVNNGNMSSFQLTPGMPLTSARFIFADLNGTISAWAGGLSSTVKVTTLGAVYTGLAINSAQTRIYAARAGGIDVFDSTFAPVSLPGGFIDPNLPTGFVPFNVQNIGGKLYVTYAPGGAPEPDCGHAGHGDVDVFDEIGVFQQRLVTGSQLAAPWGSHSPQPGSACSAATCSLAISASPPARSMRSTRLQARSRVRSR